MMLTNGVQMLLQYFDLHRPSVVGVETWGCSFAATPLVAGTLVDLVKKVTQYTGRMRPLPEWSQRGAVVGLEGGQDYVPPLVDRLYANNVPIAGVWLQDWVGLRSSYDGDRLIWNWELNLEWYPKVRFISN